MPTTVAQIYWLSGGSGKLDDFPWKDIEKPPVQLTVSGFKLSDNDLKKLLENSKADDTPIVVFDLDTEDQVNPVEDFVKKCPERADIILLVPNTLLDHVAKIKESNCHLMQKPVRRLELFLLIEKMVLLRYYQVQAEKLSQSERDLINRVEEVFEFSRRELLDRERTTHAYEKLVEYEEHLLEEQRRINRALLSLQEYRDQEKIDWEKERDAREAIEEIRRKELQNKDKTVLAQEKLLEFQRNEKVVYNRLLKEFEDKGTLDSAAIKDLLERQKKLIAATLDSGQA